MKNNQINEERRSDPSKNLIFVIGDPQGKDDLLFKMMEHIERGKTGWPLASNDKIVIMGNFLDSDENCREMIRLLRSVKRAHSDKAILIRGAKEHIALKQRRSFFKSSLGQSLINSYRIGTSVYSANRKGLNSSELLSDLDWLRENTVQFFDGESYFMCSSGIDPNKSLNDQYINSLMFLREPFSKSVSTFEKVIVHGSHPCKKVDIKSNKINVNTDVRDTGMLSCVVLDDTNGELQDVYTLTENG